MEQNLIEIEFEGGLYHFSYIHSPPQDQEPEHIKLLFQQSDTQLIGYLTLENIKANFANLNQFYQQLDKERLDQRYNFQLQRDMENIIWFNYVVNIQIGIHSLQVHVYCQLQKLEKQINEKQQEQISTYYNQVYELQNVLDRNLEIVGEQENQYQHLQQTAEAYLQNIKNKEQIEQNENKIGVVENQLNQIDKNIGEAKLIIDDLRQIYYKEIKFEDVLKVYSQNLQQSTNKQVLIAKDGFQISKAFSDRQKLKFKIEDVDKNFTFGIVPSNVDYESVNQIINNDQAQYFFVPEGDYKHGQNVYKQTLQHLFGNDDSITLIVDPKIHQISVKINNVLVTNIRNKNMAQRYKIFISEKDGQNLEAIIL